MQHRGSNRNRISERNNGARIDECQLTDSCESSVREKSEVTCFGCQQQQDAHNGDGRSLAHSLTLTDRERALCSIVRRAAVHRVTREIVCCCVCTRDAKISPSYNNGDMFLVIVLAFDMTQTSRVWGACGSL